MRVAVIADVHGKRLSPAAVMRSLAEAAPDMLIELGDAVFGPLWPT